MKSLLARLALCLFILVATPAFSQSAIAPVPEHMFSTKPIKRPDGAKWRLGYFESGDYSQYARTLRVTVQALHKLGWLNALDIPGNLTGQQMWEFLATNVHSDYLEFVRDAYWRPGNFNATLRLQARHELLTRLTTAKDIDLVLAMGTWAGQDMAAIGAPVPTVVASASDAIASGIVRSAEDSGLDNLVARVLPDRYKHQVRLFREVVPFERLGLVFEDSPEGRIYSAVESVMQVAQAQGFEVVACSARASGIPLEQATRNVLECYAKLAPQIDAAYVTVHRGITTTSISAISQILIQAHVPSFSMLGSEEVKHGLLMSMAQADYSYVGMYYAETVARIFNGAKARQLNQIWVDPTKIALNIGTADLIGYDPPVDVLLAADEVFEAK